MGEGWARGTVSLRGNECGRVREVRLNEVIHSVLEASNEALLAA